MIQIIIGLLIIIGISQLHSSYKRKYNTYIKIEFYKYLNKNETHYLGLNTEEALEDFCEFLKIDFETVAHIFTEEELEATVSKRELHERV